MSGSNNREYHYRELPLVKGSMIVTVNSSVSRQPKLRGTILRLGLAGDFRYYKEWTVEVMPSRRVVPRVNASVSLDGSFYIYRKN